MNNTTYSKYLFMAQTDPEKAYRGLAKVVDQRLVSLENASKKKGTKSATQYAYKLAMREGRNLYGEGFHRFNRKIRPEELIDSKGNVVDINDVYRARINAMLSIIQLKSSTITGLKEMYGRTADTLNERYGDMLGFDFTPENIGDFFESEAYKDSEDYGSDTVFQSIGSFKENEKEIAEKIARYGNAHHNNFSSFDVGDIIDDPLERGFINDMIRRHGVRDLDSLYKGFGMKVEARE